MNAKLVDYLGGTWVMSSFIWLVLLFFTEAFGDTDRIGVDKCLIVLLILTETFGDTDLILTGVINSCNYLLFLFWNEVPAGETDPDEISRAA